MPALNTEMEAMLNEGQDVRAVFDYMDVDNSGSVGANELRRAVRLPTDQMHASEPRVT